MWTRRAPLGGHTFTACTGLWVPFVASYSVVAENSTIAPKGLYVDIMDTLQRRLNFSVAVLVQHEHSWKELVELVANRLLCNSFSSLKVTYKVTLLQDGGSRSHWLQPDFRA